MWSAGPAGLSWRFSGWSHIYTAAASYRTAGAGASGVGDDNLSAPNVSGIAGGQGKFVAGSTLARPTGSGDGADFWVDVIFDLLSD
ncbi:hypothetical protein Skr01_57020 [Sphaerisporangium krabiense]|uniref:Uncharacterized protein n=1 Tax=Sphaerisporangium krabiense TaxID=763782 RepID=A0A7W9DTK9_9ACTN|nr:hypothetical protein [Sphaerisporangium krabiense]MBB5629530.1 hypothetical protein [Sphaerisporangium krabiense]GII65617.1 hypothetical protein Skr01_57020 [Sphaerisporangium krabiense]